MSKTQIKTNDIQDSLEEFSLLYTGADKKAIWKKITELALGGDGDIKSDGSVDFTADQSMGGNNLTDVADPTNVNHVVNLGFLNTALSDKQDEIVAGTTSQYFRGDKTFQTLNTSVVPTTIDKNYVTDLHLITLSNTSNTNTGDDATNILYENAVLFSPQTLTSPQKQQAQENIGVVDKSFINAIIFG